MAVQTPTSLAIVATTNNTVELSWVPFKNDGTGTGVFLQENWDDTPLAADGMSYPCMIKGEAETSHWRRNYESKGAATDGGTVIEVQIPGTEPPWGTRPRIVADPPGRLPGGNSLKIEYQHGNGSGSAAAGRRTRRVEMILMNGAQSGKPDSTGTYDLEELETYAWSQSIMLTDNGDFTALQGGDDYSRLAQTHSSVDSGETGFSPIHNVGCGDNKFLNWWGGYMTKAVHGSDSLDTHGAYDAATLGTLLEDVPNINWRYDEYADIVWKIKVDSRGTAGAWPNNGVGPYVGSFELWINGYRVVNVSNVAVNSNDEDPNYGPFVGLYSRHHAELGDLNCQHGFSHKSWIGQFCMGQGDNISFADVAPNGNITNYGIEQRIDGGAWTEVTTGSLSKPLIASAESVTISGLDTVASEYEFRLKAISSPDVDNEESGWTNIVTTGEASVALAVISVDGDNTVYHGQTDVDIIVENAGTTTGQVLVGGVAQTNLSWANALITVPVIDATALDLGPHDVTVRKPL